MRQIKPPGGIPQELSSVFRHVYDEIQKLAQSINQQAGNETTNRTDGKSGDIRLVNDKAFGGYSLEGRFDEGWVRFNLGEGQLNRQLQRPPLLFESGSTNGLDTIQSLFPPVTTLSDSVQPGLVVSIPIIPIGTDGVLKQNDIITIVSLTGFVATFTLSSDVGSADTNILVNSTTIPSQLQKGNGVYLTQKSLATWISQLDYAISIGAQVGELDVIARVNAGGSYLTKGTTYTPSGGITVVNSSNTLTITRSSGSFSSDGVIVDAEIEINGTTCVVTSTGTTTIIAIGTTTSGTYSNYILGRTSIPVTPLPITIRGDLLWKVIVKDLENGQQYVCQTTSNSSVGSTNIFIKPKILGVQNESSVTLDQLSLISYINIAADGVEIRSNTLTGALFVGNLASYAGTVDTLYIASPYTKIKLNSSDVILIVDELDYKNVSSYTVSSNTNAGSSTIPIFFTNVEKATNSKVFLSPSNASGSVKVLSDQISLAVSNDKFRDYVNGQRLGQVLSVSGSTINLSIGLSYEVFGNDTVRFSHNPDIGQTITSHPSVITKVTKVTLPKVPYASGTTAITVQSSAGISSGMIMTMEVAGSYSTGSSINIFLDNITIDTNILKSDSYVAGTTGWAIKNDGSAEFNSVTVRGNFETTASSGNYVKLLTTNGEVLSYASSTSANSGGLHVLSNSPNSSRYGLTLHENGFASKQSTRKFTIYHNNDVAAGQTPGGSLVFQYSVGTPSIKFWGVADPQRPAVTAGTFEAVGNSRFYGNFYKANDKAVEFNVTDAANSSVFKVSSVGGSFHTTAGSLAGYILVDINGSSYKMPFYN